MRTVPFFAWRMFMKKSDGGILLIEDDRVDIMTVERALSKSRFSHTLHVARTAVEALAMLRGEGRDDVSLRPELILLDLNLPRMSGIEFLREIRSDPALDALRVIVLTSSNEPSDREAAFKYEVEDYIVKPHSFDAFAEAIDVVLRYSIGHHD
jgi:CheY-like chemotaxis protein